MKWVVSIVLFFLFGCAIDPSYKADLQEYMLPGIEGSYRFSDVFKGEVYKYHKAVSYEPVHPDVIYFATGPEGILLLNSDNVWEVLSKDRFASESLSWEFSLYIFKIEYSDFELIGKKRLWERNPFYCDKLDGVASGGEATVFASLYNEFIRVEYVISEGDVSKLEEFYQCEI